MIWKFACLVLMIAVAVPNGISAGEGILQMKAEKAITLGEKDNGREITVRCGEVIRIELPEMGAAGYRWHLYEQDKGRLELLSEETKVVSGGKIGGPVTRVWLFRAAQKGITGIAMDHYRLWEGKGRAIKHFSITVIIE